MKNKSFNHNILKYNMRVIKNIIKKKMKLIKCMGSKSYYIA